MKTDLRTQSTGNWLTRAEFAALILTNQWTKLGRRPLRSSMAKQLVQEMRDRPALAHTMRMHKKFNAHRNGAPSQHKKASQ
jgi:hypothetical protein